MRGRTTFLLVAMLLSAGTGCGGPGYRVVRSDPRAEYPEGPMAFEARPTPHLDSGPTLLAAMRSALASAAPRYRIVEASGAPSDTPFTIRVEDLRADPDAGRVSARVRIVDRDGAVTSELEVVADAPALDDAGARRAGTALGEALARYLDERADHHC